MLPEVAYDMTGGVGVDPAMTRAVPVPTVVLPEVVYDMTQPALRLTVRFRADPPPGPGEAAGDVLALSAHLTRLYGDGLAAGEPTAADATTVELVFRSAADGAADRLARLAAAVNAAEVPLGRTVAACTAAVRAA
jgi:hypothetical protein